MTKITTDAEAKAVERLAERLRYWEKRKWNEDVSLVHIAKDLLSHISDARLASTSPAPDAAGGCDYVPGRLDREAPPRVWLQIDTSGNNDERDEPWPGPEYVTWQDESIGGLEIQYVRADLAAPQPVVGKNHE